MFLCFHLKKRDERGVEKRRKSVGETERETEREPDLDRNRISLEIE